MTDLGFTWEVRKGTEVFVRHHGKPAATLRGRKAAEFLDAVNPGDPNAAQQLLARLTGNYKRGNERSAKGHDRNA